MPQNRLRLIVTDITSLKNVRQAPGLSFHEAEAAGLGRETLGGKMYPRKPTVNRSVNNHSEKKQNQKKRKQFLQAEFKQDFKDFIQLKK